eukprot:2642804-Prymnesium_polylepis.1
MAEEKAAAAAAGESIVDWESDEGAGDGEDEDEIEQAEDDDAVEDSVHDAAMTPARTKRRKSAPQPSEDDPYFRGDLVWAKIHGFPWWPSQ